MNKLVYLLPILLIFLACGGGGKATVDKSVSSAVDSIESIDTIDAMSEELGNLKTEIEGRQNELDSLIKEIEKDSD